MVELNFNRWRVESDSAILASGKEDDCLQVFNHYRCQARFIGTVRLINQAGHIVLTALDLTGCHPVGQSRLEQAPI